MNGWQMGLAIASLFDKRSLFDQRPAHGTDIDGLCGESGWRVDEREGDVALLHFNDPGGGVRKLSVWQEQAGCLVFVVASRSAFGSVPPAITQYLLQRNPQLEVGAWATEPCGRGVAIAVIHRAHGLTGAGFRRVCELMVQEAVDFDAKLRHAGFAA